MRDVLRVGLSVGCAIGITCLVGFDNPAAAADYVPFTGEKTAWHAAFDRYDYLMDQETFEIQPFKRSEGEGTGVSDPPAGKRRCIVIVPKQPAKGNPWSWQGCYWNHEPQAEVELMRRGYHVVYISANANLKPDQTWEAWYKYLTTEHGLSPKPAFVGMSRGGEYAYTWAARHPDQVSAIYGDNPAINAEGLSKLPEMAKADIPILHVCGSIDPLLGAHSNTIETIYRQLGGRVSVIIKDGAGHHPHSLRDPALIAGFITQNARAEAPSQPAFVEGRFTKNYFYTAGNAYEESPTEHLLLTRRGAHFVDSYERYVFNLTGVEAPVQVILPKVAAAHRPWVFRADVVTTDSTVDLALLSEGYAIVTGPVPYNADGPHLEHWNKVYDHLTTHGFSKKPVLAGCGGAAGEAYAWAGANPDKISCIYAENPLLRSHMTKQQPLDTLQVLAKAKISILHACGSLDPFLETQTRVAEKKYHDLGGELKVLVTEGVGHYPTAPHEQTAAVQFITSHTAGAEGK